MNKLMMALSMLIFSSIGLFRRYILISSSALAMCRGIVGALFLGLVFVCRKQSIDMASIKKNGLLLCLSGVFLGLNWILLFEAYRYTTISVATLCYYMAPIFILIVSPLLNKDRFTAKRIICIVMALVGMVFVSGVLSDADFSKTGVFYGLMAAVLYSSVVMMNQRISGVSGMDRTLSQLSICALVLLPYVLATDSFDASVLNLTQVLLIVFVGIIHTGVAYLLYFSVVDKLESDTVALYAYIDPIGAIILSVLFLSEPLGLFEIMGAVLILTSAMISEKQ